MKKSILISAFLCCCQQTQAQLYVTPGTDLFIEEGTELAMDSLLLIPQQPLTLNGQSISRSNIPVDAVSGNESIKRVYSFQPVLSFNGTAGILYATAELNGNTEQELSLAFTNGGDLNISAGSKVNALTNKVTRKLNTSFGQLTAAQQPAACTKPPSLSGGIVQTPAEKPCPGETRVYSVSSVTGATGYQWTTSAGADIVSGQGTPNIVVQFNAGFTASAQVSVHPFNDCGSGTAKSKGVSFGSKPKTPSAITGDITGLCGRTSVPYTVVDEGYDYTWSFSVSQATVSGGQGSGSITADFTTGFPGGKLSVTATNGCGVSSPRVMSNIKALPEKPSPITGLSVVCPLQAGVSYSIPAIPNVLSYTWTSPVGSLISDGATTSTTNTLTTASNSISVSFGVKNGSVKVQANNACGAGGTSSLSVSTTCTGVKPESEIVSAITLYPSPVRDVLHVAFSAEESAVYKLRIMDALGRELISSDESVTKGNNELSVKVAMLVPGVYYITLQPPGQSTDFKTYKKPFVVQ